MSQTIIVSNETYERLAILKRNIGPKMSFDSVIGQMLKKFCSSTHNTDMWIHNVHGELQRLEVYRFIRELQDADLLEHSISEGDVMAMNVLLVSGNWLKLDELVHSKAEFMRQALARKDESMEVLKSHWEKENMKSVASNGTNIGAESVDTGIVLGQKLGLDIKGMRARQKKSKQKSKSKRK